MKAIKLSLVRAARWDKKELRLFGKCEAHVSDSYHPDGQLKKAGRLNFRMFL